MKREAILRSVVVALGLATGSLLAPQAASALDFTFSFGQGTGVSGLITGLVEGTNSCTVQAGPCFVTVLNAGTTGSPTGNYFNNPVNPFGAFGGFTVAGSSITSYEFLGSQSGQLPVGQETPVLVLSQSLFVAGLGSYLSDDGVAARIVFEVGFRSRPSFNLVPTATSVPGPLPVFGAAAAFGYSRRLRKRVKGSSNAFSAAPLA
jgi:hypothetical protein